MKKTTWPGNWKVACHVCGFWYPSSEIQKRWDGVLVCQKDYETRHPQTLIKVRGERAFPSFVSKDASPDPQVFFCDINSSSGYAGMATAGCAHAGPYQYTYDWLIGLLSNGHTQIQAFQPYDNRADFAEADFAYAGGDLLAPYYFGGNGSNLARADYAVTDYVITGTP